MRGHSQYAQISFAEASFRIFPLRLHIDSPAAEAPLVVFPQVLVAETRIGVDCVWWCLVELPVKHFIFVVSDVDSPSLVHTAAVLGHVP